MRLYILSLPCMLCKQAHILFVSSLILALCVAWWTGDMASGTIYRKMVWLGGGLTRYTRGGYQKASRNFKQADLDVEISSCSFMITGANSGIGKIVATELAKKGATVHLVCRNPERGEAAKQEIITGASNEKIHLHLLDLSKPKDVARFTDEFVQSGQQLDVLVNNAGCIVNQRELTEDGLEKNFATNSLGTYMLTIGLIPVLQKSSDPRVVTVSSGGMLVMKLDPHDLQFQNYRNFDGMYAYAQNKRQQVVMTRQWSTQWPDIHFSSMHPGWADTPVVRESLSAFHSRMGNRLRDPMEGADTIVWLCVSEAAKSQPSGLFFEDRAVASEHLPLAWTRSSQEDEVLLMSKLQDLADRFRTTPAPNDEVPRPDSADQD